MVNRPAINFLQSLRKLHARFRPEAHRGNSLVVDENPAVDASGEAANDLVRTLIASRQPLMIGRIGGTEIPVVAAYAGRTDRKSLTARSTEFITGRRSVFWWTEKMRTDIAQFSGFFPATDEMLARYSLQTLDDISQLDVLGTWLRLENTLLPFFPPGMKRVRVFDLQPFRFARPWSAALAGRTVLVIHPFDDSIRAQYAKRKLLFANPTVLPDFELKTLRAVQSLVGNEVEFPDWFAALDHMRRAIDQIDFDLAIIGAGAYGLPLAAHIKRLGRQAIHLGGVTQILFGIRGLRWDTDPALEHLYNEHWIRPSPHETPQHFKRLETGAYW